MITIEVNKDDTNILSINISGHAEYAEHGKDIVCAAVSSIAVVTVNAISKFDIEAVEAVEKDGYLDITLLKLDNTTTTLMNNMLEHLSILEEDYPEYIKIVFKEDPLC